MRVLDLCSGIGGFSLGLERAGMTTVAFCEIDDKCQQALRKHWPDVPQYTDIKTLTKEQLDNDGITDIRLICGGYPCQPFSLAGKRAGEEDNRHVWPEMFRLICELRPDWVIAENVTGHISMGLDSVLSDLESQGYTARPFVIPAVAVDAKHRRDRVWIVANTNNIRGRQAEKRITECQDPAIVGDDGEARSMANANPQRLPRQSQPGQSSIQRSNEAPSRGAVERGDFETWRAWPTEPPVGRVVNGLPGRVDRLKQLGNSVVPQIPEIIGNAIMAIESSLES